MCRVWNQKTGRYPIPMGRSLESARAIREEIEHLVKDLLTRQGIAEGLLAHPTRPQSASLNSDLSALGFGSDRVFPLCCSAVRKSELVLL